MRGKKSKSLLSQPSVTGSATLWRSVESSLTRQGILFEKANSENKRINPTDELNQQPQAVRLPSLYITPVPLADGISEQND